MISFKKFLEQELPVLDSVIISTDSENYLLHEDRKWISGRFPRNIGIDKANYGAGQEHAHIYGRKGNQVVVVNFDGTRSHGTRGRIHKKDANALRDKGYKIPMNNIVEWIVIDNWSKLIVG